MIRKRKRKRSTIGWREWAALPDLGVDAVKVKVDTGARTSAIHAFRPRKTMRDGVPHVAFLLHPEQRRRLPEIACELPILDERRVVSSNGDAEMRYVVKTRVRIGKRSFPIELTLTNRDQMGFRMLLGREALRGRYLVDSGKSFLMGRERPDPGDRS